MRKPALLLAAALLLAPAFSRPLAAWGAQGHQMVASAALKDLPPELAPWFVGQEPTLRSHANDPDHWKDRDPRERPRHYLDCEPYGGADQVPQSEAAASAWLGGELFVKCGRVPWSILDRVRRLAAAFRAGDPDQVGFEAAILSHYVGDLHVPLHTTRNHNGQESGQHGIHGRWETGLLDRIVNLEGWVPEVRPAVLGADPEAAPWQWLQESFQLVPRVLADDRRAEAADVRGLDGLGRAYWQVFLRLQEPEVKERLTLAGQRTARMVVYAWTLAGRPQPPEVRLQASR